MNQTAGCAVVVGYGSIGRRHCTILDQLGMQVGVVTRAGDCAFPRFDTIAEACAARDVRYVVVANETARHARSLRDLSRLTGAATKIVVEKPVFDSADGPEHTAVAGRTWVAYNLRFDPLLRRLHRVLQDQVICSMQVYAGQYLPDWRPQRDYRRTYSASRREGGGVVRDLSHELDYICWLTGAWQGVFASVGHRSALEITSEDTCSALLATERCDNISFELNYTDRLPQRAIICNTNEMTIRCDLVRRDLQINDEISHCPVDIDLTYIAQHQSILGGGDEACTLREGVAVVRLIEAIEKSSATKTWVSHA